MTFCVKLKKLHKDIFFLQTDKDFVTMIRSSDFFYFSFAVVRKYMQLRGGLNQKIFQK